MGVISSSFQIMPSLSMGLSPSCDPYPIYLLYLNKTFLRCQCLLIKLYTSHWTSSTSNPSCGYIVFIFHMLQRFVLITTLKSFEHRFLEFVMDKKNGVMALLREVKTIGCGSWQLNFFDNFYNQLHIKF
jgi:hypothetical protein